jgi:predicted RecB family nuclease
MVYTDFERCRISELAERFPDLAPALRAIIERLVDLHPLVRDHYYHPQMKGSWSLKVVLPTVAPELDYGALDEVQDGLMAQTAYLEAIDPQTASDRREALRRKMLDYCAYDTLALVRVAHFLAGDDAPAS